MKTGNPNVAIGDIDRLFVKKLGCKIWKHSGFYSGCKQAVVIRRYSISLLVIKSLNYRELWYMYNK